MLSVQELILKKKRGTELTSEEISFIIAGYTSGDIPDYQMSALLMAICFVGMSPEETKNLTLAMAHSGDTLDLSSIHGIKVDKHSTGGVGDKTSLILGPMVASLGIPVAKMSGRGLSHTGGTIDKLESIEGFSTSLDSNCFIQNVNTIHMAIAGQTKDLAPADKKLYALRDVTGTVDQMSLIAASIMSKKLASGADAIILDVKTGDGAFMKSEADAIELASEMVSIGKLAGKKMTAVISDMDQPLGYGVGNALEIKEVIQTLHNNGPEDLKELCITLGSYMVIAAEGAATVEEAREKLQCTLEDGSAFNTFLAFVKAQGGNVEHILNPDLLPTAQFKEIVSTNSSGYVEKIQTEEIGRICLLLGGGRETKDTTIDLSVGVVLHKKKGDFVDDGEELATIYANDLNKLTEAKSRLLSAYSLSNTMPAPIKLIKKIIQ